MTGMAGDIPGDAELYGLASELGEALLASGGMLALAESCTGGWIAQTVTAVPGSSRWFDRGFVTYSNAAKIQLLGVDPGTIEAHGAVSAAVVQQMAAGALQRSAAQLALAVTGIAGPDGGSAEKPVGLVFLAWQRQGQDVHVLACRFNGGRQEIRRQTVATALRCLLRACGAV